MSVGFGIKSCFEVYGYGVGVAIALCCAARCVNMLGGKLVIIRESVCCADSVLCVRILLVLILLHYV